MSGSGRNYAYVRREDAPILPPPAAQTGVTGWLWRNMLQSMANYSSPAAAAQSIFMLLATVGVVLFAYAQLRDLLNFAVFEAVWVGEPEAKRLACATEAQGGALPKDWFGACYPFISAKWKFLIYYNYPVEELWRVNLVFLLGSLGIARFMADAAPRRFMLGSLLVIAGVAYGLLVNRLFDEPFGVRVGVQILLGLGLLFLWLKAPSEETPFKPITWGVLRLIFGGALLGLVAFATLEAGAGDRNALQAMALRLPLIVMTAALLFAATGPIGAMMLTAFPLYAFVLLTGADLEIGRVAPWVFAAAAAALIAIGYFGSRGVLGPFGEIIAGLATPLGYLIGIGVAIAAIVGADYGLATVETNRWGGLMVTLVVAVVGIVFSLPLGVLLALGRRSSLPAVRYLSIIFIEFWRGVPLITVLFMSSVMLPLFLPDGVDVNKLMRALVGVMLFAAAYQAEVVRGGLQAIPKGQFEGAQALGLGYWRMMALIVLPQALTLVIPGIVNTFIGLFKDTSLVLIISLFDLLGAVQASLTDNDWATPVQAPTGYLLAALIFWIFCFGMSRYSLFMERKLRKGHAR